MQGRPTGAASPGAEGGPAEAADRSLGDDERSAMRRGLERAMGPAGAFKQAAPSEEALGPGGRAPPAQRALPDAAPAAGADASRPLPSAAPPGAAWDAPDASRPGDASGLQWAAGPYREAFERRGLRMGADAYGRPALLGRDGRPASAAEQRALIADIRAEPAALVRDPAVLSPAAGGISRAQHAELKDVYRRDASARAREMRDISLAPPGEERDFDWSRSCQRVSGDCNPHAKADYQRGQRVSKEELRSIWDSLGAHIAAAQGRARGAGGRAAGLGGLGARLRGLFDRLLGGGGSGPAEEGGVDAAAGPGARPAPGAAYPQARGAALGPGGSRPEDGLAAPAGGPRPRRLPRWPATLAAAALIAAGLALRAKARP